MTTTATTPATKRTSKTAAPARTRKNPPRRPDPSPWPTDYGYISVEQMMHALGGCCVATIYSYFDQGLLPRPDRIGLNRVGWKPAAARQALDELPAKVAALRSSKTTSQG